GMSAVARLLLAHGDVTGSDTGRWPLSEALIPAGVTVHDTFDARHVEGSDVVVRSSAYKEDNAEVAAALAAGIPVWKRQDAWRFLAKGKRVVAVAGTHGKTTTTAMTWTALRGAGIDASLICGAALADTGTNAHAGTSDVLVIEADEYDRAFHALEPEVAVVTNLDHDHVDLFPTLEDYREAFRVFVAGIPRGGTLVACADDAGAAALADEARRSLAGRSVRTYGTSARADIRVRVPEPGRIELEHEAQRIGIGLKAPGEHNARNAAAAVAAAMAIGAVFRPAAVGLLSFLGTSRRLELLGESGGVTVIDDYAHHPVEIRASIAAVRRSGSRVVAVFQPHTASRLGAFFDEFADALRLADRVVIAETFASARGDVDARDSAHKLADRAGGSYARDPDEAAHALAALAHAGDTVLVLGAGDIRAAGERLLELLRETAPA
ncbi:MAG: UDP-N-acetylmuramate--L-alanine ligase, partial [Chloroflexota bacterium]|nr:UDP-N-acetylmuramate--L-alanine ligase [Chloroflexota bacterium]